VTEVFRWIVLLTFSSLSIRISYSQEMPSRFKKEVVRAAKMPENEAVALEGLERVLHNIGASHKISLEDLQVIFNELGEAGSIPADRMVKLI